MRPNVLFHPTTTEYLQRLKDNLPQSLLVSGPRGIGLTTAAKWLAKKDVIDHITPRDAKGVETPAGTISVEAIRRLYEQTRSRRQERHIVIIGNADRMSSAAHGAFLKLLEEPSASTYFILTSHFPHQLPATIRSRVQQREIQPLTSKQTALFLEMHGITDSTKKLQLEFIAAGLPAELTRLINDDAYFSEKATIISDARDFLRGDQYKRLLIIFNYRHDRVKTLQLCDSILTLLRRSVVATPQPGFVTQIERFLEVREQIAANGNALLQLTRFVV